MIGKLRGIVEHLYSTSMILDVSGVGYIIHCSQQILMNSGCGEQLALWIYTHVKEAEMTLYGFNSVDEKSCFETLITVQGIGGKVALSIMNILSPALLVDAIIREDVSAFKTISGIGAKLAARIMNELKNTPFVINFKCSASMIDHRESNNNSVAANDAISALVNLGFNKQSAMNAVQHIIGLHKNNNGIALEDLIREALNAMHSG